MKRLLRLFADVGIVWPFVIFLARVVEEVKPRNGTRSVNKPTLLALHPEYFRGDLEIFAESGRFRVLKLPFKWQYRILNLYWNDEIDYGKYFSDVNEGKEAEVRRRLREFLRGVIKSLFSKLKVDLVISACIWYKQDIEWGCVSDEVGVPYVVLHRENLVASPVLEERWENITKARVLTPKFLGSHIIVHNAIVRNCFIRSGFVDDERISALGCLRMDSFVKTARRVAISRSPKKVVLFSFVHGQGIAGVHEIEAFSKNRNYGLVRFFDGVHGAIGELALQNKGVEFYIKIKPEGNPRWLSEIEFALSKKGIESEKVPNLKVVYKLDAQELILKADVVCGFGSTALLEAAIAAKPVIIPFFYEAACPGFAGFVMFKNDFDVFDIAGSIEEFKRLILRRLDYPEVGSECMSKRYALFEKYVSSMDGSALDKYVSTLSHVLHRRIHAA